ncbi:hypothetical protein GCM10010425_49520 [Streptomyces spororaveus]|uniref:Uncharacterized protein n=1 Tax=Streptomyces spororaveus TaxID=284039 RepID=A0ABQ3T2E0_9ACTN|nr:hypothetical protein Sspor_01070 [Streptomyces spororaveus]
MLVGVQREVAGLEYGGGRRRGERDGGGEQQGGAQAAGGHVSGMARQAVAWLLASGRMRNR